MAMKRTHDAVYAGEKYTDRDGNEKTRYVNIGSLMQRDDGSLTAKIEQIPVGFNGWINFYEPKPKDGEATGGGRSGTRAGAPQRERPQRATSEPADFADDPIPFVTNRGPF